MSQSPPEPTLLGAKGSVIAEKVLPPFCDLKIIELAALIAPPKMQLCESTLELGSAKPDDAGIAMFAAKVAGPGGDGGAYALGPPVCFVNQVFARQLAVQVTPPGCEGVPFTKAMFAFPSGSIVIE